jgi:hypothetical protein
LNFLYSRFRRVWRGLVIIDVHNRNIILIT